VRVLLPGFVAILMVTAGLDAQSGTRKNLTLTAVPGIKVGHHTLTERPTGCTVILTEAGATAGVDVRGAAPGTRETDLLNPVNSVQQIYGLVFAGGSAFGLDAASGVMKYLDERNIGFKVGTTNVPIVPAAILMDLGVGVIRKFGQLRTAVTPPRARHPARRYPKGISGQAPARPSAKPLAAAAQ